MSAQRSGWGGLGQPDEPAGAAAGITEERRATGTNVVAAGSLSCPDCDAPVSPGGGRVTPRQPMRCPVCDHDGTVRDFLSLASPTRPAHVRVVVSLRATTGARGE